jgi:hypothetical protein
MDDSQFADLMERLRIISGHLETLVLESRERHTETVDKLDAIHSSVMLTI